MRRRDLFAAVGLGVAAPLAGCASFDDGETETETPGGEWELRGTVLNEDDESREWRVESRSPGGNVAAASGTIPAGETWELALAGRLRDERLEVYAESDGGATSTAWRPTECRLLFAEVTITGGEPRLETECRDGETPA